MRFGFLTNFPVKAGMGRLEDIAVWALANGFEDLEVGPTLGLDEREFRSVLERYHIRISALTYCRNFLSTDPAEAQVHLKGIKDRIAFAGALGISKIVTSTGIDKSVEEGVYDRADAIRKTPMRSLDAFEKTFKPLVSMAEDLGVQLAFENCPLMGNIAISPVMWRAVFERLPSRSVGLAYDPSHLVWQVIDPYLPIAEFADRILHVHAKDTRIDQARLAECGFLTDFSWWDYCIPGRGLIDWGKLLSCLQSTGYQGTVSLEHEDPDYEASLPLVEEGLKKGLDHLKNNLEKGKRQ